MPSTASTPTYAPALEISGPAEHRGFDPYPERPVMDLQLNGTRVLVTGGTRGIGKAIVAAFLEEGATVGFCARNADDVAATQDALKHLGDVAGRAVDVGDGEAL